MAEGAEAMMTPDPASFRTVLGHFATGVTVIAAMEDGHPVGVAANSFTSVALDPPLVLFCAAKNSSTWPRIRNAAKFAVSILGDDQEDVCRVFASPGADRFSQIGYRLSAATGSPILHDAIAYVDCETEREIDAGDHVIVIGRALELGVLRHADPLLYYRGGYHSLQP